MNRLYALYATYSSGFNLVFKILPAFLAAMFGAWEISLIYAAYFGARVLIIPAGLTSDRLGKLTTIRLSLSLMALMIVLFLILFGVNSLTGWLIFGFISGIVVNLIEIAASSLVSSMRSKTESLFKLESMYQLGVVLGPIAGGFLTLYWGMEAALSTWAVLNILGILLTSRIRSPKSEHRMPEGALASIKKRKLEFIIVAAMAALVGLVQAMQELAFPLFMNSIGFDISLVGIVIGGASVLTIFALLYLGKRLEKVPVHISLLFLFGLMLLFPLLITVSPNAVVLIVLGGLFLIGRSGGLNITRGFFSGFSNTYKATLIAVGDTIYYFSRSAGSALTGAVIEGTGYSALFFDMAAITVVSMVALAAFAFMKK